ncbi:MAG: hypothetical protein CRN43_17955, partial [Candidatus Nephrothrix sp. EaCA]
MPRMSTKSQTRQSQTGHSQNNVPARKRKKKKVSGVCSHCLSVRKLHQSDGAVHLHGQRDDPCIGSGKPPLAQDGIAMVSLTRESAQLMSAISTQPETEALNSGEESTRLLRNRNRNVMKHIPKAARFACSQALENILASIVSNPDDIEKWHQLLRFAPSVLAQPPRAGRRRNIANVVKKRIDNKDYTREEDGNAEDKSGSRRKVDQRQLFLAAVNAKMEEGNIRAASRILCSQDRPTEATFDSLAAIQERHPTNGWMTQMEDLPKVTQTVPFQVSAREVEKAIRSFPAGSASGPDRLRPQHLLDLINNRESAGTLLQVTTDFINVLLRGECPRELRELIFGGTLIALSKKTGGLRPIVIGFVWRRLAAKCANGYALCRLGTFFVPLQVGIGTPAGGEAAVHAARNFVATMPENHVFVKLDFANAFNTLRRDVMLRAVHDTIPELYAFVYQAYSEESILQFGRFVVRSQMGPQQGDPLGPMLFCLPLQPTLRSLKSHFKLGYLDDISLGGHVDDVRKDLAMISELDTTLGLSLNRRKCEYYTESKLNHDEFENFVDRKKDELTLLGSPLFKGEALDVALQGHSDTLGRVLKDLVDLQAQAALILLRACFGAAKTTYLLRTSPCWNHPLLDKMDSQTRAGLNKILNTELNNTQWIQASLPIRDGGLGTRRLSMLATSAYLASAASTVLLVGTILGAEEW